MTKNNHRDAPTFRLQKNFAYTKLKIKEMSVWKMVKTFINFAKFYRFAGKFIFLSNPVRTILFREQVWESTLLYSSGPVSHLFPHPVNLEYIHFLLELSAHVQAKRWKRWKSEASKITTKILKLRRNSLIRKNICKNCFSIFGDKSRQQNK